MHVEMSECIFLLDKMAAFAQMPFSNALKFVPNGSIDDKPVLVLVRVCAEQATSHYLNKF